MIKQLIVLLFVGMLCCYKSSAQTQVKWNFSATPKSYTGFINLYGHPHQAVLSHTATNGWQISTVATQNWSAYSNVSANDAVTNASGSFFGAVDVFPSMFFQYHNVLGNYDPAKPQIQISGLNTAKTYTLRASGSLGSLGFDGDPVEYRVAGQVVSAPQQLNGKPNPSPQTAGVTFTNVAPAANGTIKFYANTINGQSEVVPLAALVIEEEGTTTPTNQAPVVSMSSPQANAVFTAGASIALSATASDPDGTISKVEFYNGAAKLGEALSTPYTYTITNAAAGTYTLTARAYDNNNLSTNSAAVNVTVTAGNTTTTGWSLQGNAGTTAGTNFLGTTDNVGLQLRTNNLARLHINSDGLMAMGTTTVDANYLLSVNGRIKAKGIRVQASGWPDYVFAPTYKLPTLQEVEAFIRVNKHLPGIAPAREVEASGVELAEMQIQLLQKIEELTLYIIEQNKKMEEQAKKLEALEKQMKKQ
jgi:hypothetical protein